MPFDWREFLIIAHELRTDRRESAQRTCLGRAYYYVYHLPLFFMFYFFNFYYFFFK